jgi:G:T/U-mismatch repair DNA glycosylase
LELAAATKSDARNYATTNWLFGMCCEGKKAEQLFRTMVYKQQYENMMLVSLPSTSPAYAAMSFRGKLDAWREGLALNPV